MLAERIELCSTGIKSIVNRIPDGAELLCRVPSDFTVWIGFKFDAPAYSVFSVATEIRSYLGRPLAFDSGKLAAPSSGSGEWACPVTIPVLDVGPCIVSLLFDGTSVWQQRVFFAMS